MNLMTSWSEAFIRAARAFLSIMSRSHASFPKNNSILLIGAYEFKILRSTRTKIELIEMKKISNL